MFLEKEFENVPDEIRDISLQQIQQILREICVKIKLNNELAQNLHLIRDCAKIYAVLDFAQKFKRVLSDKQDQLSN